MDLNEDRHQEVNDLLNGVFKESTLRNLFDARLHELDTNQTTFLKMYQLEWRALNGVLDGTQKRVDYVVIQKLAVFLNKSAEEIYQMYLNLVERNFEEVDATNNKKFIRERFDLTVLKKAGFIEDVNDIKEIENKILKFFGFNSVFEYKKRSFNVAFSAGAIKPKNTLIRDFWLTAARSVATRLDNPYQYDRQGLIKYFPQIRWYSTNVELGLVNVIKALFRLGITVTYQAPFSSLHLRGATIPVSGKPCILLSDYKGFYPTLWHCLIHELYHVLFDWDAIKKNDTPHLTEDASEVLTIDDKETEADNFAREYLFSAKKMQEVGMYLKDQEYVEEVAKDNHVHPSFIYIYHAFDNGNVDRMAWARAKRNMPEIRKAIHRLENPWSNPLPIDEFAKKLKLEIYN